MGPILLGKQIKQHIESWDEDVLEFFSNGSFKNFLSDRERRLQGGKKVMRRRSRFWEKGTLTCRCSHLDTSGTPGAQLRLISTAVRNLHKSDLRSVLLFHFNN